MMRSVATVRAVARIAAGAAAALALTVCTPASAGQNWSVQKTPTPPGAHAFTMLLSVSCSSARACTAVGDHVSGRARTSVAERWNGIRWVIQQTPSSNHAFSSVSCPAAAECIAVGGINRAAAERWDGNRWQVQPTPVPAGSDLAAMMSVSCAGPASCMAVGSYLSGSTERPLAELWNGRTWTIERISTPTGFGVLSSVSCTSPAACTAVGAVERGRSQVIFAEHWNGLAWTEQRLPAPRGVPLLTGVSCAGAGECTAVGLSILAASVTTLAEHWNGRGWSVIHLPAPPGQGPKGGLLESVSCASASMCIAVGAYANRAGTHRVLTEIWNGSRWAVLPAPDPSGRDSQLQGVSCPTGGTCLAVGGYGTADGSTATLAEHR